MIKQDGWSHVEPAVRKEKLHIGLFSKNGRYITSSVYGVASMAVGSKRNPLGNRARP